MISDGMAAAVMSKKKIDAVIIGADRIARNGDTANKIGSLELAITAKHYGVPFYVAAPKSTFDSLIAKGEDIIIEERSSKELAGIYNPSTEDCVQTTPNNAKVFNPAFDITPAELIAGYITEDGVSKTI
jgi:methylthioribose-1-phosphate isomerase